MLDKERLVNFLKELTELTIKYHLKIEGCGCCGSPYIVDMKTDKVVYEYLEFNKGKQHYD